ncbi:E3 ubiquitin-protein ligase RHF1A-like [Camellia sinensis]|uniref:E3 ubiquitin-protein ligase RHF1A-like n=1 Tax=Camellia sinensis TaxID=4442 RepID=UPI00103586CB|nr:E3 ubiquitin-protein ligase RHF1A-like [Camellia sinensis]
MADFVSSLDNPPMISAASSSGATVADHEDDFKDACSICLEPFNSQDPPTVTNCRHEYHLQCFLAWSQRSKECPIRWQLLVLKDPSRVLCSPESPQRPSSTEFLAFSESVKSKFSVASARYKESISKSTRGFKEKLLAHNISVKELGRGVQRERNAGIAGAARMIERLDLPSKRTGISVPLSSC